MVWALLSNSSVLENQNPISHTNRRKSVRDYERHLALRQLRETLKYFMLRASIQCGGRVAAYSP